MGTAQIGGSGSENLLKSGYQLGLRLSERLTTAVGTASKVAHLHAWQVGVSWRPPFLVVWTFPQDCLSVLLAWQLASPRMTDMKEREREAGHNAFCELVLRVIKSAHTQREGN